MFCSNCGKEIPTYSMVCPYCGAKTKAGLAADANTKAAVGEEAATAQTESTVQTESTTQTQASGEQESAKTQKLQSDTVAETKYPNPFAQPAPVQSPYQQGAQQVMNGSQTYAQQGAQPVMNGSQTYAQQPAQPVMNGAPAYNQQVAGSAAPAQKASKAPKKKKNGAVIAIVAVVAVLVLLIGGCVGAFFAVPTLRVLPDQINAEKALESGDYETAVITYAAIKEYLEDHDAEVSEEITDNLATAYLEYAKELESSDPDEALNILDEAAAVYQNDQKMVDKLTTEYINISDAKKAESSDAAIEVLNRAQDSLGEQDRITQALAAFQEDVVKGIADQYLACLESGDLDGALTYTNLPAGSYDFASLMEQGMMSEISTAEGITEDQGNELLKIFTDLPEYAAFQDTLKQSLIMSYSVDDVVITGSTATVTYSYTSKFTDDLSFDDTMANVMSSDRLDQFLSDHMDEVYQFALNEDYYGLYSMIFQEVGPEMLQAMTDQINNAEAQDDISTMNLTQDADGNWIIQDVSLLDN